MNLRRLLRLSPSVPSVSRWSSGLIGELPDQQQDAEQSLAQLVSINPRHFLIRVPEALATLGQHDGGSWWRAQSVLPCRVSDEVPRITNVYPVARSHVRTSRAKQLPIEATGVVLEMNRSPGTGK